MSRAKANIVRLLKTLCRQGIETVARKRLKGSLFYRTRTIAAAQGYLSQLRQSGDGTPVPTSKSVNVLVSECRKTAESIRVDCSLRLRNIEYLLRLAGLCDVPEDPSDKTHVLISTLVAANAPEPAPTPKPANRVLPTVQFDFDAVVEAARRN